MCIFGNGIFKSNEYNHKYTKYKKSCVFTIIYLKNKFSACV